MSQHLLSYMLSFKGDKSKGQLGQNIETTKNHWNTSDKPILLSINPELLSLSI